MLRLWTRYFGAGGWEATNLFFSSYEEGQPLHLHSHQMGAPAG